MAQVKVMFARFPYGNAEHPDVADWLVETVGKAKRDPRVSEVVRWRLADTPITMSRNRCLKIAQQQGVDIVCMIDSDMKPDLPLPGMKPFWDLAFDFVLEHEGPCAIAAPYCGPPPHENVYIFQWGSKASDHPNLDIKLDQFVREDAAGRGGIERVAALPTGLMLIDMRALRYLEPPWFDYEWADPPFNTEKASTEDVYFTRNLSLAGVPVYVTWDSWAGHWKPKLVGKPIALTCDQVNGKFRDALLHGRHSREKLIMVGEGKPKMISGVPPELRIVSD